MSRWKPDAAGRLVKAALDLFDRQGYEDTTVADISEELERLWVSAVRDAPDDAGALAAVEAGLGAVADMFTERHAFAQVRARVVAANPELQERELIKLERLASSVAAALEERGVKPSAAELAGQTGVRVFHLAFARWIAQEDPAAFYPLIKESLGQLRELLTN